MLFLDNTFLYIREFIAAIGVAVITGGAIISLYQLYMLVMHKKYDPNQIRLQFWKSVILGLEFMVGADIIGSLVNPNYYSLGLLAIIVSIRSFLSYFINLELEALTPKQRKEMK